MNSALIESLIALSIGAILLLFDYFVMFRLLDKAKSSNREPNGKGQHLLLGTGNGIGFTLLGDFRVRTYMKDNNYKNMTSSNVTYHFFTFFFLPILPFGCYRVIQTGYHRENHKRATTSYKILGSERWNLIEDLSIYISSYAFIIIGVSFIAMIASFF